MEAGFYITVEKCNQGKRGIFCRSDGTAFFKPTIHSEDEMWEVLCPFDLILAPKSEPYTEEELKQFNVFIPLAEYSNVYGIAATKGGEDDA